MLHHVQAAVDGLDILQREQNPAAHHAAAHRRDGAVDDIEQRLAVVTHGGYQFQVADGKLVQTYITLCLNARQVGDVTQLGVLGDVEIVEDGTAGDDGIVHARDTEALEVLCLKVLQQAVVGGVKGEDPVLQVKRQVARREGSGKALTVAALDEHLLRGEIHQQLVHILFPTLGSKKFTRTDVKEGHTQHFLAEVDGCKEIVLLAVEHRAADHHTGRHQFGDAALDEFLGQLGVLQLVADGDTLAGTDEFGQIGVQGMVGKTRHLGSSGSTVAAPREGDAQNLAGSDCILQVGLIKVTHTEQQYRIGMLGLHLDKLLHHRRIQRILSHLESFLY